MNNGNIIGVTQRHTASRGTENVLVLQGGGSLGAFACGVFKALYDSGIRFDIVGGSSIGAVSAAIICGSKSDNPAKDLEDFWIEIAESSSLYSPTMPDLLTPYYDFVRGIFGARVMPLAPLNAIMFGVPKFFVPLWQTVMFEPSGTEVPFKWPMDWTHYYDHSPLVRTLEKYVDYEKISSSGGKKATLSSNNPRMITTAVNVLTAKALVFDSAKMEIKPKHILASSAYSGYGFPWIEVDDNVYAWDGSLLSNTPLQEVIEASPRNDKNVFIVENYPRKIDKLPANRSEVVDRTRDIIFSDKTIYDLRAWSHMSKQTALIERLYEVLEKMAGNDSNKQSVEKLVIDEIRREYENLVGSYGAEILSIHRIARSRMKSPHILKNADFSIKTVKDLIRQGEQKALDHLKGAEDIDIAELTKSLYLP